MKHQFKIFSFLFVVSLILILASYSTDNLFPQAIALTARNSFLDNHATTSFPGGQKICGHNLCATHDYSKITKAIDDFQKLVTKPLDTQIGKLRTTCNPIFYFFLHRCPYQLPDEITRTQYLVLSTARVNTVHATVATYDKYDEHIFIENTAQGKILSDLKDLKNSIINDDQLDAYNKEISAEQDIGSLMVGTAKNNVLTQMELVKNQILISNGAKSNSNPSQIRLMIPSGAEGNFK